MPEKLGIDRYTVGNIAAFIVIMVIPFTLLILDWLRKKKGRDP